MKKIVIAPDSYKGTRTAEAACLAISRAAKRVFPEAELRCLPMADGGEGTVAAFLALPGSEKKTVQVSGPMGEPVTATWATLADGTAVLEMAAAAGFGQTRGNDGPLRGTTYGVGEMILHAAKAGAKRILLGLGGSCTNDGGAGAAAALGVRFLDEEGNAFVPVGETMERVRRIDTDGFDPAMAGVSLELLCDVTNPLYGPQGAAFVFAPQKGADADAVERLDRGLRALGDLYDRILPGASEFPGAGAAGGLGAGLRVLAGAKALSGADAILDLAGEDLFRDADLVITGEGRFDSQSLDGKLVSRVAARAKGAPVLVFAGLVQCPEEDMRRGGIYAAYPIHDRPMPMEEIIAHAAEDLEACAFRALSQWKEQQL